MFCSLIKVFIITAIHLSVGRLGWMTRELPTHQVSLGVLDLEGWLGWAGLGAGTGQPQTGTDPRCVAAPRGPGQWGQVG